jgi:hypothetical protein
MKHLQEMIEELSNRADDSDLIALLATNPQRQLHHATLAQELRDVAEVLKSDLAPQPFLLQPA